MLQLGRLLNVTAVLHRHEFTDDVSRGFSSRRLFPLFPETMPHSYFETSQQNLASAKQFLTHEHLAK